MNIKTENLCDTRLIINSDYSGIFEHNGIDEPSKLWNIISIPVKKVVMERGTERVFLNLPAVDSKLETYIKRYSPIPLKEKLKNIICAKPYNYNARHEWNAICLFHSLELPTMTPLALAEFDDGKSCILTLGITEYERASAMFEKSLSEDKNRRRKIIREIASIAANMHSAGIAHQDFYLVHFFIKESEDDKVYLIDLQRAIISDSLARRWIVKDLGQLLYSARKYVSDTDILFFWKIYSQYRGGHIYKNKSLIKSILAKAERLQRRDDRKREKQLKKKAQAH